MSSPSLTGARSPVVILLAASVIAILVFGPRSSLGIFTDPITSARGWGRDVFALAIGIQHLVWGLVQPIAGAIADRYGSRRVICAGALLYALGFALMPMCSSPEGFVISAGFIIGLGLGGTGFPIVVAALGRLMPENKRSLAIGIATASGSIGQFLFAPLGQHFVASFGWQSALSIMAATVLLILFVSAPFSADASVNRSASDTESDLSARQAIALAFAHPSYVFLTSGFFVCGFHVSFVMAHLPPYLTDIGITATLAAWSLSLIGLFNVVGAFTAGYLGGVYSKRYLLSTLYLIRAIVIAAFLLSAKTDIAVVLFSIALGLLWLSTVPLTSGLVALMFGTRYLGTLFGIVFLSHQLGAFIGVWMGGYLYESTGSYDSMWVTGIGLSLIATALHWPIDERRAPAFADPVADSR